MERKHERGIYNNNKLWEKIYKTKKEKSELRKERQIISKRCNREKRERERSRERDKQRE